MTSEAIYRLKFDRKVVSELPTDERDFLFSIGHFANEINILQKLALWVLRDGLDTQEPQQQGAIAQGFLVLRILAGKLYEGHKLIQGSFYGTALSNAYKSRLNSEATEALKKIKRYFRSSKSLVKSVRNDFAFHYSPSAVGAALSSLSADEELVAYVAEYHGNNLLYFAEVLAVTAMVGKVDEAAMSDLRGDITSLSMEFLRFSAGFLSALLKHRPDLVAEEASPIDMGDLPDGDSIAIPFFSILERIR